MDWCFIILENHLVSTMSNIKIKSENQKLLRKYAGVNFE